MQEVKVRMLECGLELHKDKTKIVYCKDDKRKGNHPIVKFDFLGFSFQPRSTFSRKQGKLFLGYDCAISIKSKKQIADKLEELDIIKCSFRSIVGIAYYLNPYIRGWVNYYGKFRISALNPIFQLLQRRILRWARKRYKRYKTSLKRAGRWLKRMRKQFPYLFYHWKLGF